MQLRSEGVCDERVLDALWRVPREQFVPTRLRHRAYENVALPIGGDQTISQPYVVAHMAEALHLTDRDHLLEVGTGSGYGAAVLAELAHDVVTLELRPALAESARERLQLLGYSSIQVLVGDGGLGWPPLAPYDAIAFTAATPSVPPELFGQLRVPGGRLVAPVGDLEQQKLLLYLRTERGLDCRTLGNVRFVPLLGVAGFHVLDPARKN